MSHKAAWLATLLLLFTFFPYAIAGDEAELYRSVYKGNISGWKVEMVRTLTQAGERYTLKSEAKNMFGSIKEVSDFEIRNKQLYPSLYVYERKVFGRNATEKIQFDWSAKTAHYSRSDRSKNNTEHKIVVGVLDPALYQLVLQADLASGKKKLDYTFIKRKRLEHYDFETVTKESFSLNKRTFDAQVVIRENEQKDKITKLWVVPELDYQVAQIQHTDDGDTYQVQLASHQGDSAKIAQFYKLLSAASLRK